MYEIGVNAGKQKIVDNLRVQSPGANYCHFPCATITASNSLNS
ncbi:MAG: hypothetical protein ACLSG5_09795 [Oscillospiraceae bacterium]